jgi:hypothetical protein
LKTLERVGDEFDSERESRLRFTDEEREKVRNEVLASFREMKNLAPVESDAETAHVPTSPVTPTTPSSSRGAVRESVVAESTKPVVEKKNKSTISVCFSCFVHAFFFVLLFTVNHLSSDSVDSRM